MSRLDTDDSIRILHVDDEPQFRDLVATYLEMHDDSITVNAEPGAEPALDRLGDEPFDCVVSDYQMNGMDGLEFLQAVRQRYPNLPFILFTGRGSEEVAADAIDCGVSFYLQKEGSDSYRLLTNRIRSAVERKRSERQARVARDRLFELYEQTDGFFMLDEEWTVTYWNEKMVERTGCLVEDVVGESYLETFPDAEGTEIHDAYSSVMAEGDARVFETYYEPHGYWVEVKVFPAEEGLFVHSRDITDKKEREQEVQRRNRILESFANTVSHDLRNPLNVAEGRLELAQETGDFEHLEEVSQAHNRMRNLIDELLRIAQGEELSLSEVSLEASVSEAWETVESGETELVVEGDATFEAHESQLRRFFENLLWNAIDHGGASRIHVGTFPGGFYVADDGVGIPPDERDRVFETGFSTADDSPGYGLAMVQTIAETHGWTVTATESRDGGARFEVGNVEFSE